MTAVVIGEASAALALADALRAAGLEAHAPEPAPGGETEIATLAEELLQLEGLIERDGAEVVVLADASDRALAGVLVAAKLLVPVAAVAATGLLAQVADRVLPAEPDAIVAWARSATGPSTSGSD